MFRRRSEEAGGDRCRASSGGRWRVLFGMGGWMLLPALLLTAGCRSARLPEIQDLDTRALPRRVWQVVEQDPGIPRREEEIEEFARRLFDPSESAEAPRSPQSRGCNELPFFRLASALRNPSLREELTPGRLGRRRFRERLRILQREIGQHFPHLDRSYRSRSGRFVFRYSADAELGSDAFELGRVELDPLRLIMDLEPVLDRAWEAFAAFHKPPRGHLEVHLRDLGDGYFGATAPGQPLLVNFRVCSSLLDRGKVPQACRTTVAHELFHQFQYHAGFRTKFMHDEEEGAATLAVEPGGADRARRRSAVREDRAARAGTECERPAPPGQSAECQAARRAELLYELPSPAAWFSEGSASVAELVTTSSVADLQKFEMVAFKPWIGLYERGYDALPVWSSVVGLTESVAPEPDLGPEPGEIEDGTKNSCPALQRMKRRGDIATKRLERQEKLAGERSEVMVRLKDIFDRSRQSGGPKKGLASYLSSGDSTAGAYRRFVHAYLTDSSVSVVGPVGERVALRPAQDRLRPHVVSLGSSGRDPGSFEHSGQVDDLATRYYAFVVKPSASEAILDLLIQSDLEGRRAGRVSAVVVGYDGDGNPFPCDKLDSSPKLDSDCSLTGAEIRVRIPATGKIVVAVNGEGGDGQDADRVRTGGNLYNLRAQLIRRQDPGAREPTPPAG